ncbi:MAG: ferritin family protein [Candidatus Alcyoniella australis]|nr:ferritin family protein [Candidatus Alcyoniella australis]
MSPELLDPKQIIAAAINREQLSARNYETMLQIVRNPQSQKIINRLRNEELRHKRLLTQALSSGELERIGKPQVSGKLPKPEQLGDESVDSGSSPREVLQFALMHEQRAVEYYARYVDIFQGTAIGELFVRLKREEEGHREQLELMLSKLR